MDSPSAPQTPDPTVVAKAQGDANIAAAQATGSMNRVNQITPYGSLTYTQNPGGTGAGGAFDSDAYLKANPDVAAYIQAHPKGSVGYTDAQTQYNLFGKNEGRSLGTSSTPGLDPNGFTQTLTLDPRVQAIIDSQLQTSAGLEGSIQGALGRVNSTLSQGIDYGSLPQLGDASQLGANLPGIQSYDPNSFGAMPQLNTSGAPGIPSFDTSGVAGIPGFDDAARKSAEDASYHQLTSRLDPQYQQQEDQLRSALMNRGMVEGSEGWKQQMDQFSRSKTDAYQTAMNTSIGLGDAEQQRMFDMGLQAHNTGMNDSQAKFNTGITSHNTGMNDALSSFNTQLAGRQQGSAEAQIAEQMAMAQRAQKSSENLTSFNAQNTQHDAALSDAERKRSLVLNELAALRGGQQVNMPQFGSTPQVGSIQPAPIAQATENAFQGQLGAYNAQVGSNNASVGAAGSVAAMVAVMI